MTIPVFDFKKDNCMVLKVTIKTKNQKQFRIRLWIACKLIKLAAWISWMDLELNITNEEKL